MKNMTINLSIDVESGEFEDLQIFDLRNQRGWAGQESVRRGETTPDPFDFSFDPFDFSFFASRLCESF